MGCKRFSSGSGKRSSERSIIEGQLFEAPRSRNIALPNPIPVLCEPPSMSSSQIAMTVSYLKRRRKGFSIDDRLLSAGTTLASSYTALLQLDDGRHRKVIEVPKSLQIVDVDVKTRTLPLNDGECQIYLVRFLPSASGWRIMESSLPNQHLSTLPSFSPFVLHTSLLSLSTPEHCSNRSNGSK